MKKKVGILAVFLAILMCFLTIGAFAGEKSGNSQMPFIESDEIFPEYPDVQTEEDLIKEFEEMFGEGSGKLVNIAMVGIIVSLFFIPALIVVIVFGVLNRKTKKKIKEYERFFGAVPQNAATYCNQNMNNNPYAVPSVNQTGFSMGNAPTFNQYIPQNDNNQQGGQL